MLKDDVHVTAVTIQAAAHDPEIPISEHKRKEFFYKCFTKFSEAILAEPAIFADQVKAECSRLKAYFGVMNNF